jgi:hypothetical protein
MAQIDIAGSDRLPSAPSRSARAVPFAAVLALALALSGCATLPDKHAAPLDYARKGGYGSALEYLDSKKTDLYTDRDAVVYDLDTGILRHYAGDYAASTNLLRDSETRIEDLYTKSVMQEVSAFIVNDTMLDYPGEDYEDIYTNLFMSLNYAHDGNLDDAIVEMNRFLTKQQKISSRHQVEIEKARGAAKGTNTAAVNIEFHNSALAQYLTMLLHRADGDMDAARHDQHMIDDAFKTQKTLYPFSVPTSVGDELSIPKKKGRLNVLAFSGLAPVKYEEKTHAGDFVIAIPLMRKQPSSISWMEVTAKNLATGVTTVAKLEQIESVENIAVDTFRRRSEVIYNKAVARMIVKGVTTVASREIGKGLSDSSDSTVAAIGSMLQLFSSINRLANEVSEQADLRTSRYFPARADVGGLTLDPGNYDVSVSFYGLDGKTVLATKDISGVAVEPSKLAIVEATCLGEKVAADLKTVAPPAIPVQVATDTANAPADNPASGSSGVATDTPAATPAPSFDSSTGLRFGLSGSLLFGGGSEWGSDWYSKSYGDLANQTQVGGGFSFYCSQKWNALGFRTGLDILINNGMSATDTYTIFSTQYVDTAKLSVMTIDLPLLLSYDFPLGNNAGISVFGGPHLSFPISANWEYTDTYFDSSSDVSLTPSGINLGFTFGAGYSPPGGRGFVFELRYVMDLGYTKGSYDSFDGDLYRRRIWLVSAGYQF